VQTKEDQKTDVELSLTTPASALGPWEFIDFAYYKDNVAPVTITLWWELNNQFRFKIREEVNFALNYFYFQINKEMRSGWKMIFETSGAAGTGITHQIAMTYK